MSIFSIGWESVALNDCGVIQQIQFVQPGVITGIQLSIGFMGGDQKGDANVLFWVARIRAASWSTYLIDPNKRRQIALPTFPAIGNVNFIGPVSGGGAGGLGMMFANCLKTNLPTAQNWCGFIPYNVDVQPGDGLIMHMDHMGKGPVDAEMQGSVQWSGPPT